MVVATAATLSSVPSSRCELVLNPLRLLTGLLDPAYIAMASGNNTSYHGPDWALPLTAPTQRTVALAEMASCSAMCGTFSSADSFPTSLMLTTPEDVGFTDPVLA